MIPANTVSLSDTALANVEPALRVNLHCFNHFSTIQHMLQIAI